MYFKGSRFCSYLTIEKAERHRVPVLLWLLEPQDERNLDSYEGYSRHYRKEYLKLKFKGKSIKAMVCMMNKGEIEVPLPMYAQTVLEGYMDCNFDLAPLNDALMQSNMKL